MSACFDAVTVNSAKILGLADYGVAVGHPADLVLLQASDPVEAIRLRAQRLSVWRRGELVAQSPPASAKLHLAGRPPSVDWRLGH
jgi:cytosine deaminase